MIDLEPRVQALEEKLATLGQQQLTYPLDFNSMRAIQQSINRTFLDLLTPLETAAANEGTSTLLNNTPCIQLADAATREAYFAFVPHQELILSKMEFIWSTPAVAGNLYWQVDIGEGGDSDQNNARTTGGTSIATAADGTANDLNVTDIGLASGISLTKLRLGNLWGIKFSRLGAHASDTLSNTVNLYGILITYRLY